MGQWIDAIDAVQSGRPAEISIADTTYIVIEPKGDDRAYITVCYSKAAVTEPDERVLEPAEREIDAVTTRAQLFREIHTAVEEILDRMVELDEDVTAQSWYNELRNRI